MFATLHLLAFVRALGALTQESKVADVTTLKVLDPSKPTPNEGVVRILRDALARAKSGEVRGVAITLAVIDAESPSGRGSIHLMTYEANYKDTLYTGVGAMEFSMKLDMHKGVVDVDKLELKDHDESEDELSCANSCSASLHEVSEPPTTPIARADAARSKVLPTADRQTIYSESTDPRLAPGSSPGVTSCSSVTLSPW